MLSADQVTAIAPDAPSLKAGKDLATPRKWQLLGGDEETLWGLAMGSGKQPYQTRVSLSDFATKCSCPSRKFPCKHAIALMLLAANQPAELTSKERPAWLEEWLHSRADREEKKREKSPEPTVANEAASLKRREKREVRIDEGIALLRQSLIDLVREGLASPSARGMVAWENLHRRMTDSQAPGLAGAIRYLIDEVLRSSDDERFAWEIARLFLITESYSRRGEFDEATCAELSACIGDGPASADVLASPPMDDEWFVAGRETTERDRLTTSVTWLFGVRSRRWAKILKFAHAPATVAEPWPPGGTVRAGLSFFPGLVPTRALAHGDGQLISLGPPSLSDEGFESLLDRHAAALAKNPFLRSTAFLTELRPDGNQRLADPMDRSLPWSVSDETAFRVRCISGGRTTMACGEWDGYGIRLLAVADGPNWVSLSAFRA